jgi:phage terminase large subunit-like protein
MLPRGQGKTSLVAVLALYELFAGEDGAQVVVVATDERQAGLCFRAAVRMVELNPDLERRVQLFQDRMVIPKRGASFQVLPAVPKRLEGLDYTLAILDEAGRIDRDVFEVVTLATGKQRASVALAIGTLGPELDQTVLGGLRTYVAEHPDDPLTVWREWSAAGFEHHPVDCAHCWELANPALDDFLARDGLQACLPPKMRESSFRRARLCQFVDQREETWLPLGAWAACADATRSIPDQAEVVLGFDGSFSRDCTVPPSPPSNPTPMSGWNASGRPPRAAATGACPWSRSRTPSGPPACATGCSRSPPTPTAGSGPWKCSTATASPCMSSSRPPPAWGRRPPASTSWSSTAS